MATMRDVIISTKNFARFGWKNLKARDGKKKSFSGVTLSCKLANFLSLLAPAFIWSLLILILL